MKKFLLSGAALLIASTLAIAAPVKVGVSIANFDDTFLTYMMDGMKAYAKAHAADVEITFTDAKEDMAKQLDQVENFIVQKKDAIIIVPVDTSATAPMTKNIVGKGIKAVYVNRNPGNLPDGAYYVGSEEIVAGRLQMEFLGEKLKGKGNIAILIGKLDNEGALKRTAGNEEVQKAKYPNIKILDKQTGQWQRNEGLTKTEDWLNRFGKDLQAILSNNDDMALGAIQALIAGIPSCGLAFIVINQRLCLLVVNIQTLTNSCLFVIGTHYQRITCHIINTINFGWIEDNMVNTP